MFSRSARPHSLVGSNDCIQKMYTDSEAEFSLGSANMSRRIWGVTRVFLLGVALLSGGCTTKTSFRGPAYQHEEHAYAVAYDDAKRLQILGDEWILDNYRRVPAKNPEESDSLVRKTTSEYLTTYSFDLDDNGSFEDKVKRPAYDLLFKNRKTNAQIWLTTIPLSRELADKELRVLLNNYVENISGSGFVVFDLGANASGKRFWTRVVERGDAVLSGKPALVATVEVANVDQLKLSPDARKEQVRIVMTRPDVKMVRGSKGESTDSRVPFRVLLVAGYSNDPEDFEKQYPEYKRFLSKVHLLTHSQAMDLLQPALQPCAMDSTQPADLVLAIDAMNEVQVEQVDNLSPECTAKVVAQQPFPFMGKARHVKHRYDWSKPIDTDWLSQPSYSESQRVPPTADPAATTPAPAPVNVD